MNRLALSALVLAIGVGCGGDDDGGAIDGGVAESCTATFSWWQKDAYLDAAGRNSTFWPPHTTTTLEFTCTPPDDAPPVAESEMVNHGTSIDDTDMDDAQILALMREETVSGTRAELTDLVAAYEACECGTTFLSLDALGDSAVMDLVDELSTYLTANMTCPVEAGGVAQLVSDLTAGDIAAVLALAPMCTFAAGSWQEGLDDALAAIIAAAQEVLADYHVCNNDALLQAELWNAFASDGSVGSCDTSSLVCAGPEWFLACDESDRSGCLPASF
jgi:hypothetical protein